MGAGCGLPPGRAILGQGRRRGQSKAEMQQVCEGEQAGGGVGPPPGAAHSLVPLQSLQRSPGCQRAQRRILGWGPAGQRGLFSAVEHSTPAPDSRPVEVPLFPGVGSGSVLSVVAFAPLTRPRVAMAGEAISPARLLLDSSCHSLFPARRSSRLKQGQARPFFKSGRGRCACAVAPVSTSCLLRLLTQHLGPGAQAFAGPSLAGPTLCLVADCKEALPAPPPAI